VEGTAKLDRENLQSRVMNCLNRQTGIKNMMMQAAVFRIPYRPLLESLEVARSRGSGQIVQSQAFFQMCHIIFGHVPFEILN